MLFCGAIFLILGVLHAFPCQRCNCKFVIVHITAVLRSSYFDIFSERSLPESFNRWSTTILFFVKNS